MRKLASFKTLEECKAFRRQTSGLLSNTHIRYNDKYDNFIVVVNQ